MSELDRALADITDIHTQIAEAKLFRGFGPTVIAVTGALAFMTALLQTLWPALLAKSAIHLLSFWIGLAVLSVLLIGGEVVARARREHGGLADAMVSNVVEQFLPAGMAGAAFTLMIFLFVEEAVWILPGLWQVLVSLGIFAGLKSLPRAVAVVAAWYFIAGIASFTIASQQEYLSPWLMGLPFGVGQALMAIVIFSVKGAPHVQDA